MLPLIALVEFEHLRYSYVSSVRLPMLFDSDLVGFEFEFDLTCLELIALSVTVILHFGCVWVGVLGLNCWEFEVPWI